MTGRPPSTRELQALRWLIAHGHTRIDRHSLFDYYSSLNGHGMGMETVSRRGAAGRMASQLEAHGFAEHREMTPWAREVARG